MKYSNHDKEDYNGRISALEEGMSVITEDIKSGIFEQVTATREVSLKLDQNFKVLVDALTGKDHVPTKILNIVVRTMGAIIFGCVVVIVFLLTGMKFGLIPTIQP